MIQTLKSVFSADQILTDEESLSVYSKDWTTYFKPKASAVVFPKSEKQVQELVRLARKDKLALVPSGGRTGLSGGAVALNGEIVVSFEKMNRILDFNEEDLNLRVEAGAVTDQVKEFADEKGYFFPVSFASSGSSQIGGNIATNAGGVNVLKYGLTRNWIAGVDVVTGRGDLLRLNHGLTKNATGYDLRHLMIGSEGTLGFVTAADLRLSRKPFDTKVILLAISDWSRAMEIFVRLRKDLELLAFEIFDRRALEKVLSRSKGDEPFQEKNPLHLVIEVEKPLFASDDFFDQTLGKIFDDGLALDGVVSSSSTQARELWSLRENISESIAPFKPYKNDISVRTSKIPEFVQRLETEVKKAYPDFEVLWFGHIGDGNLHLNILKPENLAVEKFVEHCRKVDKILFSIVKELQGSISAEHGVGLTKKDFLLYTRDQSEVDLMKQIKSTFDPDGILNPGKIFDL